MDLNDEQPIGNSGKEIHAVFLPEQVLGGLNGSHRCLLLMQTQDPPLSGQAGRGGGT